eukprot:scaffold15419_cov206-Skeletonema_marinoi.AAC.5
MSITPSQAFSLLQHHANVDIHPLKLTNLCTDEDRVNSMISVHNSTNHENVLLADYSRQRMTLETIHHLLRFQAARRIGEKIRDLAWGRMAPGWKLRNHHNVAAAGGNSIHSNYRSGSGGGVVNEDILTNVSFANGVEKLKSRTSMDEDEDHDSGSMFLSLRAPRGLVMYNPYDVATNNNSSNNNGEVDRQKNVVDEIHNQWDRIETLTESFRQGKLRVHGPSGKQFTDVLVVSPGDRAVVPSALEFIYEALKDIGTATVAHTAADVVKNVESMASTFQSMMEKTPFKKTNNVVSSFMSPTKSSRSNNRRRLKVLTSSNTRELNEVLGDLSPATTIVVTLALVEASADMGLDRIVREWIFSGTNSDPKRECQNMFLVTASPSTFFGAYPRDNTFVVPRHSSCEAFSTLSAAGLLPLSFIFGWNVVSTLLSGAHDLDQHFVDTCPRHNLPIMLSLVDLWNDALLNCSGRLVSPDKDSLRSYTRFAATLEDQVLNGLSNSKPQQQSAAVGIPSPIVDSSNVHDNLLNASSLWSAEFVTTLDPSISQANHGNTNIDKMVVGNNERICSMFATADTFAFGDGAPSSSRGGGIQSPGSPASFVRIPSILRNDSMQSQRSSNNFTTGDSGMLQQQRGNRPCTIVISGSCSSFAIGQFIALAEHRALVKAWLYDCDPFAGAKDASASRERMMNTKTSLEQMYRVDPNSPRQNLDAPHSLATNSMLQHYANRMQQKYHQV